MIERPYWIRSQIRTKIKLSEVILEKIPHAHNKIIMPRENKIYIFCPFTWKFTQNQPKSYPSMTGLMSKSFLALSMLSSDGNWIPPTLIIEKQRKKEIISAFMVNYLIVLLINFVFDYIIDAYLIFSICRWH